MNPQNTPKPGQRQGPDPDVTDALETLNRTELTPLEEQLFKGWMIANGMGEAESESKGTPGIDFRKIYQKTSGKVLPTGQLQKEVEKTSAIETLMKAQQSHEDASPIRQLIDMQQDR
jgi:hypothetical protein